MQIFQNMQTQASLPFTTLVVKTVLKKQLQLCSKDLWGYSVGLATLAFKAFGRAFGGVYPRENCPEQHRALLQALLPGLIKQIPEGAGTAQSEANLGQELSRHLPHSDKRPNPLLLTLAEQR